MNSSEGLRGFITFLILLAILTTGTVGFSYISTPTNTTSQADEPRTEPLNLTVNNVSESQAEINWTTVSQSSTQVIYSKNLNAECLTSVESESTDCLKSVLSEPQTSHKTSLINLEPETTYFFRVIANGKIYPSDKNHTFRTSATVPEPSSIKTSPQSSTNDEYDGFGEVDTAVPQVIPVNQNGVLGASDDNVAEPIDPLGDVDKMMQEEFKEALTFNDVRYDFNKDGEVTMADYPLFIEFVVNYDQ